MPALNRLSKKKLGSWTRKKGGSQTGLRQKSTKTLYQRTMQRIAIQNEKKNRLKVSMYPLKAMHNVS